MINMRMAARLLLLAARSSSNVKRLLPPTKTQNLDVFFDCCGKFQKDMPICIRPEAQRLKDSIDPEELVYSPGSKILLFSKRLLNKDGQFEESSVDLLLGLDPGLGAETAPHPQEYEEGDTRFESPEPDDQLQSPPATALRRPQNTDTNIFDKRIRRAITSTREMAKEITDQLNSQLGSPSPSPTSHNNNDDNQVDELDELGANFNRLKNTPLV
ncbi:hypothetical protein AJ79_07639 [Helicocarpus griseus UAMH5409]|uniref:Uncharacterized protein n=1 Tax=Helicocarpus griseus UAMH5409 TaxID=1447875 RepID=A0A2B7X0R5_9EURO|nr:hypothetical protein AJ79_07639 [Helicocarpus griseus UAMH5409]